MSTPRRQSVWSLRANSWSESAAASRSIHGVMLRFFPPDWRTRSASARLARNRSSSGPKRAGSTILQNKTPRLTTPDTQTQLRSANSVTDCSRRFPATMRSPPSRAKGFSSRSLRHLADAALRFPGAAGHHHGSLPRATSCTTTPAARSRWRR